MTYIQECLEKFQELPGDAKEKIGGATAFNLIKELEQKYQVSLSFLIILLAIGELNSEDIYDYVTAKYKLKPTEAKNLSQEIQIKILDPVFDDIFEDVLSDEEPTESAEIGESSESTELTAGQEKELLLKIFSEKLVEILKVDKTDDLQKLNIAIFKIFQADDLIEEKIINIFYNNQEIITPGKIILNGSDVRPTVSNWLKDFISENGSELFSNIVLVKYLSNNSNVKGLKEVDRDLIKKLLKLYRNLAFFPESMDNVPLEEWEVFPIDRQEVNKKTKKVIDVLDEAAPSAKSGVRSGATKSVTVSVPPISVPTSVPIPTPPTVSEIDELRGILNNYAPDSFEYKTISQEINRLQQEKK
ncbi:MAG: hypothetical protein WC249_02795 [Patescibacteria group bacterium]|jgi:hypothetical protein